MDANLSLYTISEEYRAVMAAIIDAEGEITPEISDRYHAIQGVPAEKLQRCALVIREAEATVDAMKAEEKRLADLRKSREGAVRRFKDYVLSCMVEMGIKKIDGDLIRLTVASNPPALSITNEDEIPPQFFVERTVCELDRSAIKDALKSGFVIPGAALTTGNSLRIK